MRNTALFCVILTPLLIMAVSTILPVAGEDASPLSDSKAVHDWLKAEEKVDGPGRLKAAEAFGHACCAGDEAVFLEAISLVQEQEQIRYLLREAIEYQLARGNKDTLDLLNSALANSDPSIRRVAADALAFSGSHAIPALARALHDEDAVVRRNAVHAIANAGPLAEKAIPDLVAELLKERDSGVTWAINARAGAAGALGMIGEAAVPALMELLESDSDFVRWHALVALSRVRPDDGVSLLWNLLKEQEPRDPWSACGHEETVEFLSDFGTDVAYDLALNIYEVDGPVSPRELAQSSELIREVVGMLAWAMRNDLHADTRYAAVDGIGSIGNEFREDITMWEEKYHAALLEVLHLIGKAAVPALVSGLSDEASYVQRRSIDALGELGPAAASGASALERLLTQKKTANPLHVDIPAAGSLYLIGGDSAPAAAATLINALSDDDEKVRSRAFNRLTTEEALWSQAAVPTLTTALNDENAHVRRAVAIALENLGLAAEAAVPFLEEALTDQNPEVRQAVAHALESIKQSQ